MDANCMRKATFTLAFVDGPHSVDGYLVDVVELGITIGVDHYEPLARHPMWRASESRSGAFMATGKTRVGAVANAVEAFNHWVKRHGGDRAAADRALQRQARKQRRLYSRAYPSPREPMEVSDD